MGSHKNKMYVLMMKSVSVLRFHPQFNSVVELFSNPTIFFILNVKLFSATLFLDVKDTTILIAMFCAKISSPITLVDWIIQIHRLHEY